MKNLFLILFAFVLLSGCKTENPVTPSNMPANGYVEVTSPVGGETYIVGSSVTLSFKVNADKVSGVTPWISIDNGITWYEIVNQQISPTGTGGQLLSYTWKIGQEVNLVPYANTNNECKIQVRDYNDKTKVHTSALFSINK